MRIFTEDEWSVFLYIPVIKHHSIDWRTESSPKSKRFRWLKIKSITFLDKRCLIHKKSVAEGKSVTSEFYVQAGRTVEVHFESEAAVSRERKLVPFRAPMPLLLRQQRASCRIVMWRRSASHLIHLTSHQPTFHTPQSKNRPQKNKKISGG
jgi:hypothetical protein